MAGAAIAALAPAISGRAMVAADRSLFIVISPLRAGPVPALVGDGVEIVREKRAGDPERCEF